MRTSTRARTVKIIPPDEVQKRIEARADDCVALTLRYTREAAGQLSADRLAFAAWAVSTLGPVIGVEVVRRVDLMLGGPVP